jgi:hypothetical protein
MSRLQLFSIFALFIGSGYWLSSSAADPRGTPAERDLQCEVDQLRLELNELRARLDALEGSDIQPAGGRMPTPFPPALVPPTQLPDVSASRIPVPVDTDRPSWAPQGSIPGEINGHSFYIIPLNGTDRFIR